MGLKYKGCTALIGANTCACSYCKNEDAEETDNHDLSEIGFNAYEIGVINNICREEGLSVIGLLRQAIRKFQGADGIELNDFSKEGFLGSCSEQAKIKR